MKVHEICKILGIPHFSPIPPELGEILHQSSRLGPPIDHPPISLRIWRVPFISLIKGTLQILKEIGGWSTGGPSREL